MSNCGMAPAAGARTWSGAIDLPTATVQRPTRLTKATGGPELFATCCRQVRVLASVNDVMSLSSRVAGASAVPASAAMSSIGQVARPTGVPRIARPWKSPVHVEGDEDLEARSLHVHGPALSDPVPAPLAPLAQAAAAIFDALVPHPMNNPLRVAELTLKIGSCPAGRPPRAPPPELAPLFRCLGPRSPAYLSVPSPPLRPSRSVSPARCVPPSP